MHEIHVLVPSNLCVTGDGLVSFPIQIAENKFEGQRRECRLEGIPKAADCRTEVQFLRGGVATLTVPGRVTGEITAIIEIEDPRSGQVLSGCFSLRISRQAEASVHIHTGGQTLAEGALSYQPIEVTGIDAKRLQTVGDRILIPVELTAYRSTMGVPLQDILERESFLVLQQGPDRVARVLQIHLGRELVLGRVHAHQLQRKAKSRLEGLRQTTVHWVTNWDDDRVKQLSALLEFGTEGTRSILTITNIGDYSTATQDLSINIEGCGSISIPAGGQHSLQLSNDVRFALASDAGSQGVPLAWIPTPGFDLT